MNLSCSARLLQPLLSTAMVREENPALVPAEFWKVNPDGRVPLDQAQSMLVQATEWSGDETLGFRLGSALRFGVGGPFDYAVRSAPTLRESVAIADRFARVVADSLRLTYESWKTHAIVRVEDEHGWPRSAADFAMGAFFRLHLADLVPEAARLECWFPYPTPADVNEYERVFSGATLKFGAPLLGFAMDRQFEDLPNPATDPVLHAAHCERLQNTLQALSAASRTTWLVRRAIERQMRVGRVLASEVAKALHMSRRTLSRRLEQEGTDFTREVDAVRRDMALQYVRDPSVPLTEAAYLVGFAHVESFHRAFKRWTGQSPIAYRSAEAA